MIHDTRYNTKYYDTRYIVRFEIIDYEYLIYNIHAIGIGKNDSTSDNTFW
jgi:hypothetical protein